MGHTDSILLTQNLFLNLDDIPYCEERFVSACTARGQITAFGLYCPLYGQALASAFPLEQKELTSFWPKDYLRPLHNGQNEMFFVLFLYLTNQHYLK